MIQFHCWLFEEALNRWTLKNYFLKRQGNVARPEDRLSNQNTVSPQILSYLYKYIG